MLIPQVSTPWWRILNAISDSLKLYIFKNVTPHCFHVKAKMRRLHACIAVKKNFCIFYFESFWALQLFYLSVYFVSFAAAWINSHDRILTHFRFFAWKYSYIQVYGNGSKLGLLCWVLPLYIGYFMCDFTKAIEARKYAEINFLLQYLSRPTVWLADNLVCVIVIFFSNFAIKWMKKKTVKYYN